ncbi:MAG: zf-HC2 domain-containing protein [Thermoplasmatales archaeon]|nr:zf-HC2 domain-containing protein [Thermoplasmatales archaeon]
MNCIEIQEKIIDMVLGELTSQDEILIREHLESCMICREEFRFLSECIQTCTLEHTETCECQFQETYWEEFVVSVHERISHEKIETKFPFRIVIPIAASALIAIGLGYIFLLRPSPEQTAQEESPSYYEYDPYKEMDDFSPEEAEEFIKIINQKYRE